MEYKEIIKLLEAGYTRDEIMAMGEETKKETEEVTEEVKEETKNSNDIAELKEAIDGLKKEIIASNIMQSAIKGEQELTGEDVIANIISPAMIEGGKK